MYEESATHEIAPAAAEPKGPSRRQLVKAGIWAAPVVVLAAASPAAATSTDFSVSVLTISSGQTGPWNNVSVAVKNNNTVQSVSVTVTLSGNGVTTAAPTQATQTIAPGATVAFTGFGALSVANNGNNGHTVTATASVPSGWSAGLPRTVGVRGGRTIPYV